MNNLTVRAKLGLSFGLLAFIVLVVSLLSLRAVGDSHDDLLEFFEQTTARTSAATSLRGAASARAIAARNLVLVTTPAERDVEKAAVVAAHENVQKFAAELKRRLAKDGNVSSDERKAYGEIEQIESKYGPVALNIVDHALKGERDTATAKMNADCRPLLAALLKATNAYVAATDATAKQQVEAADADYASSRNMMIAASIVAVLAAIALAVLVARSLQVALGAEPARLSSVAHAFAEGDLSPIDGAASAPKGSVMASLGESQQALAKLVGQVRTSSDSIATGSAEIAIGNADLSQRTEEQASNLQMTAASMEEMSATVKNNADTARQATQLANSASEAAVKGGEVVGQVVATMEDISASSKKINDIIGTIDGIAFQTNILALNAAVEAARAGEQGRGFAVVAGEVRSLAQRSAEAAKEIKGLIGASVEKVEAGTQLVADAGSTMEDIVSQVKRVADLIAEISSSGVEQTAGIGQVSDAVNQLDQVTQQNAALVEESAAAADSLKQQATRLAELVSTFRLGSESSSHATAARQAVAQARQSSRAPAVAKPAAAKAAAKPAAKAADAAKPKAADKAQAEESWDDF